MRLDIIPPLPPPSPSLEWPALSPLVAPPIPLLYLLPLSTASAGLPPNLTTHFPHLHLLSCILNFAFASPSHLAQRHKRLPPAGLLRSPRPTSLSTLVTTCPSPW